ncbi:MAG: integration host factor subunit alpha [SAR86 cluster bacterium]|jgi:integration host factor subunit alpha|nr:integration host factor subunit alpha [SAR86 cluster bacterium]MCS5548528.1 integration host factor subunit alpha [SAR86 cluster bacterium]|tara:strand:+ start:195 stop:494 length:300 start_codon:yes stop_codon:yes gene_type:complete
MSKTITKLDLVNHLNEKLGLNKVESKELVEAFFDEIKKSLINNEEVKLSGFGNFKILNKRERPGRNPKTGEPAIISARKVVTFKAGQKLRKKMSNILSE